MPNHIKNVWKFKNLTQENIQFILNNITKKLDRNGNEILNNSDIPVYSHIIDFDKIIPQPKSKKDCPTKFINKYDISNDPNDKEKSWLNWYDWNITYWGTKWNAYDEYTIVDKTSVTFVFNTAWSFPEPIANALSKFNFDLEIKFADEDLGNNCGILEYSHNKWKVQLEDVLPNPYNFAISLWNDYD